MNVIKLPSPSLLPSLLCAVKLAFLRNNKDIVSQLYIKNLVKYFIIVLRAEIVTTFGSKIDRNFHT